MRIGQGDAYVFYEFSESGFATNESLGTADHIVSVRKETCEVGGRVGDDVENVPYIFGNGEGRPL